MCRDGCFLSGSFRYSTIEFCYGFVKAHFAYWRDYPSELSFLHRGKGVTLDSLEQKDHGYGFLLVCLVCNFVHLFMLCTFECVFLMCLCLVCISVVFSNSYGVPVYTCVHSLCICVCIGVEQV